jgi:ElaB/YqjD/DUF883 family membrane-anchored ribosome-binding protein
MADPLRRDDPVNTIPESASGSEAIRPGPVAVRSAAGANTIQDERLLPETATDKPLGEWTPEALEDLRQARAEREEYDSYLSSVAQLLTSSARRVVRNAQDRAEDLRRRFELIRGRVQSGELQEDVREHTAEMADRASERIRYARYQMRYCAQKYPLHFVAGTAVAGFAIGFLMRMWRDE